MPSMPDVRTIIPISPSLQFYIGKLTFDIVATEHDGVALTSSGSSSKLYKTSISPSGEAQHTTPDNTDPERELNGVGQTVKSESW